MGREWLTEIRRILEKLGISVIEAYSGSTMVQVEGPMAAVELRNIDRDVGEAVIAIHVLTPRSLGGWECQSAAVAVTGALYGSQIQSVCGKMEYHHRSDCFAIPVTAKLPIVCENGTWGWGRSWEVTVGGRAVPYVIRFAAEQEQHRQMLHGVCQTEPVGISQSANSGWNIRLVQKIPSGEPIPAMWAEPFSLTVRRGRQVQVYEGCCWNTEKSVTEQSGVIVEYSGYALRREVSHG